MFTKGAVGATGCRPHETRPRSARGTVGLLPVVHGDRETRIPPVLECRGALVVGDLATDVVLGGLE